MESINHRIMGKKRQREEGKRDGRRKRKGEEFCWGGLMLLLGITGIIITIIAVCTKRTFFATTFCVGNGIGTKLPETLCLWKVWQSKGKPINVFVNEQFHGVMFMKAKVIN